MSNSESLGHKIARLLEAEDSPFDLASVKVSLDAIYARLDKLESSRSNTMQLTHPSQERFAIAEAIADEVFGVNKEKACTFEPNAKPCDHCSMCSARGF